MIMVYDFETNVFWRFCSFGTNYQVGQMMGNVEKSGTALRDLEMSHVLEIVQVDPQVWQKELVVLGLRVSEGELSW